MSGAAGTRKRSLDERIGDVERRLELRRGRIALDLLGIRERLSRKTTWIPLGVVAGALAIGVAVARGRSRPSPVSMGREERRAGVAATVIGLAGAAARLALSPQGRALWAAFRRGMSYARSRARQETSAKGVRRDHG